MSLPRFFNPSPHHVWVRDESGRDIQIQPKSYEGHSQGIFTVTGEHYRQFVRPQGSLVEEKSVAGTVFPDTKEANSAGAASSLADSEVSRLANAKGFPNVKTRQDIAQKIRSQFKNETNFDAAMMEEGIDHVTHLSLGVVTAVPKHWLPYEAELRAAAGVPAKAMEIGEISENSTINPDEFSEEDEEQDEDGSGSVGDESDEPEEEEDEDEDEDEDEEEEETNTKKQSSVRADKLSKTKPAKPAVRGKSRR